MKIDPWFYMNILCGNKWAVEIMSSPMIVWICISLIRGAKKMIAFCMNEEKWKITFRKFIIFLIQNSWVNPQIENYPQKNMALQWVSLIYNDFIAWNHLFIHAQWTPKLVFPGENPHGSNISCVQKKKKKKCLNYFYIFVF